MKLPNMLYGMILSERCPKAGWMIEEVRFADRTMTPDMVYERFKASLKKVIELVRPLD